MKTKVVILLCLIIFSCNIFGYTKEDIISYAASQEVCDSKTSAIFNTYRNTFTRLVRQKELTEQECNQIMSYLKNSVGILNSKKVCKLSDLDKLTSSEKSTIYSSLSTGANIIINAPTIGFENNSNSAGSNASTNINSNITTGKDGENQITKPEGTNGININKVDGTIDVYENGILLDKIEINQEKLTYTGPDKINIYLILLAVILIVSSVAFYFIYFRHTRRLRFVKNILMSFQLMSAFLILSIIIIKPKIQTLGNVVDMFNLKTVDVQKEVFVTEDKNIIYPSYGYVYGTIMIPNIDVNVKVAFGDSTELLNNYAGTASWSSLPTEGRNIVVSGHNTNDMFFNLQDIKVGDNITFDTNYAKCIYKVYDTNIIKDIEVDKVKVSEDTETLVLYTCYPFSQYIYSDERFVIYSKLESIEWK